MHESENLTTLNVIHYLYWWCSKMCPNICIKSGRSRLNVLFHFARSIGCLCPYKMGNMKQFCTVERESWSFLWIYLFYFIFWAHHYYLSVWFPVCRSRASVRRFPRRVCSDETSWFCVNVADYHTSSVWATDTSWLPVERWTLFDAKIQFYQEECYENACLACCAFSCWRSQQVWWLDT